MSRSTKITKSAGSWTHEGSTIDANESVREFASEFSEVEFVAGDAKVFHDISNDPARHVAGMPRKGYDAVGTEGIGIVAMTARVAQVFAANFAEPALQLAAVESGILAHRSSREHKLVAEGNGNGPARFEQGLEMSLGGLLKIEDGFAAVAPVRVAPGEQGGFGNPNPVFVAPRCDFRDGNDHRGGTITVSTAAVNLAVSLN